MSTVSTPKNGKPSTPSSTARRPAPSTAGSATNLGSTMAPNRSPSRAMAPQASTATTSGAAAVIRTRSLRGGAPVSARAAARKSPADGDITALEDQKAELQARLDELQERLRQAEQACEVSQKQSSILQKKLDDAQRDQAQLEETVHEQSEKIEELENEKKDGLRARRELEQIYEAERAQTMKEKEESQQREEDMQHSMQRMKEALAQRELRAGLEDGPGRPAMSRNSSFGRSSNPSPNPESAASASQFAPPASLQRSDSRSGSKLLMQKDKIIEELKMDLAEAQLKLAEADNLGGGRLLQLQKEMYDIKMQNARLMEENESFQLLLTEKTLNGDVAHSDLLRPPSERGGSRPPSRQPNASGSGTSLADELENHVESDSMDQDGAVGVGDEQTKRLQSEINSMKDQNKALTLYINNIISRLLQHEQFEQILDKTPDLMAGPGAASKRGSTIAPNTEKELPPPPPPKDERAGDQQESQGFLQRAKSVMGGAARRRPMSTMVAPSEQERLAMQWRGDEPGKLTENPDTAPRVPLGRSSSLRGGHRRANSEMPGAANVVTSMYRGPSPSLQGPASPGLTSPTGRGSFFASAQPLSHRIPSGGAVPTIAEAESAVGKENAPPGPQRDSKLSAQGSQRSSVISNPSGDSNEDGGGGPASPPRSTTSSGDRESRSGGAIMMGSKPRPLRLVQEAAEEKEERKLANRGSWFGWMNKGMVPVRSVSGGADGAQ